MLDADDQQYGVSRLIAFSDGVFGFSITLLITTIPTTLSGVSSSTSNQQVFSQVLALLPNFYAYVFTFYMVGLYWVIHHRLFRHIVKYDAHLMWLNLTLLLFIAFLPVPTAFLGRYGGSAVITGLYATTMSVISLVYIALSWYALGDHRLIAPGVSGRSIRYDHARGLMTFAFFAVSVGIAFINPMLAKLCWIALLIVRPLALSRLRPEAQEG